MRVTRLRIAPIVGLFAAVLSGACRGADRDAAVANAIRTITAGDAVLPVTSAVWDDVRSFYERRQAAPAWVNDRELETASNALAGVRKAREHALAPADYGDEDLARRIEALRALDNDAPDRIERLAALDTRITTALLAFGRDVAMGRTKPASIDPRWKTRRDPPDFAGTLTDAGVDLNAWIDAIRPRHPEYAALQQAYVNLLAQRDKGGWPPVPKAKFVAGRANPAVIALRQRLKASGHLDEAAASNPAMSYSSADEEAVRAFQNAHALKASGVADAATIAAMNVPIDRRLRQIAVNLERWRWIPDDLGARHFLVNVPLFHLVARENGTPVLDIRVVVGTPDNKTPLFSSQMSTVVFSPYWNIPDSIVEGETAPAIARDPGYLARNNIEILDVSRPGSPPLESASIDWDDPGELQHLAFRQRPGPKNALGHVKFLFPNPFDVYLHDTPADTLFARPGRAFSHGCIRVEEPEALAKYVLRGYSEWDDERILEAMHAGVEKHVKLRETIPVHIVYFTAWVDDRGGLHFQPDIYGYDDRQPVRVR